MKTHKFLEQLRHDDIVAAIREAEKKTSGEIRVFISRQPVEAPVTVAQAHFQELGMEKTRDRNAVLIFVAPQSHKFAVIGDVEVHKRCGDQFWHILTAEMTTYFKDSHFNRGILHAIRKAGDLLAQHFPRRPGDQNELPDEVEHD
jgi:uncharacterized membrane protein